LQLDGEIHFVQRTQDLVDLTDLLLVFGIDGGVEKGDLWVGGFANKFTFTGTHEISSNFTFAY
jgi:hypothetical protein